MLFDSHAYCFPRLDGDGGFDDPDEFRRHLQFATARHHQPVWNTGDGSPADASDLVDSPDSPSLYSLKEAGFHAAGHGRFEWNGAGGTYVKQWLPPSVSDMAYPPERLIAEMDYAGVDVALLHRTPYLGLGNDFIVDCVRRFPGRLLGLAHTPEWLVASDPGAAAREVVSAVREGGLSGLQFLPPQMDLYNDYGAWDREEFLPFWDAVVDAGVPVFFSLNPRRQPLLESYLAEHETLRRWMKRYAGAPVVMTHGLSWKFWVSEDSLDVPDEVWETFDGNGLMLQLMFPIAVAINFDYPMPQMRPFLKKCLDRVGAERLMWGTDMPMVMRDWTYRQNINFIRDYCDFLSPKDSDMFFGGTIAGLLGVDAAAK